ncbi:nucleotide-sugar transporter family protein, partial [Vibrio parahaemolyticus EKP-008]
MVSLSLKSLQ